MRARLQAESERRDREEDEEKEQACSSILTLTYTDCHTRFNLNRHDSNPNSVHFTSPT